MSRYWDFDVVAGVQIPASAFWDADGAPTARVMAACKLHGLDVPEYEDCMASVVAVIVPGVVIHSAEIRDDPKYVAGAVVFEDMSNFDGPGHAVADVPDVDAASIMAALDAAGIPHSGVLALHAFVT